MFLLVCGAMVQSGFGQSLEVYQGIALENNPTVQAAMASYKATQQQVKTAGAWSDPMLSVGAFSRNLKNGEPAGMTNISLMQNLPWFGMPKAKKEVAEFAGKAEYQALEEVRQQLLLTVSQQFYALFAVEKQLAIQESNLQILEKYKAIALAKVRSGEGLLSDVLQVDILRDEVAAQLKILELKKESLVADFNILLQRETTSEVLLPENLYLEQHRFNWEKDSLFANHPRVNQWENKRQSAEANQVVAQKGGMPMIGVGVEYMKEPMGMGMEMESIMPMVSVSIPIFRGKYKAAEKEANLMEARYKYQREATKDALASAFQQAKFALIEAKTNVELNQSQIEKTQQVLELMVTSYQNGKIDFESILTMRQKLLNYQLALAQSKASYFTAVAKLNYLLTE